MENPAWEKREFESAVAAIDRRSFKSICDASAVHRPNAYGYLKGMATLSAETQTRFRDVLRVHQSGRLLPGSHDWRTTSGKDLDYVRKVLYRLFRSEEMRMCRVVNQHSRTTPREDIYAISSATYWIRWVRRRAAGNTPLVGPSDFPKIEWASRNLITCEVDGARYKMWRDQPEIPRGFFIEGTQERPKYSWNDLLDDLKAQQATPEEVFHIFAKAKAEEAKVLALSRAKAVGKPTGARGPRRGRA